VTTYLDIAAVRIQAYLGRVPSLAGRRGASALLAAATSQATIEGILAQASFAGTVTWNSAAGDVDGVVSLCLTDPNDVSVVVGLVASHLRSALPALDLEWSSGTGASYAEAYAQGMGPGHDTGTKALAPPQAALAPVTEWPLAALCEVTGTDSAQEKRWTGPDQVSRRVGRDALTRLQFGGDARSAARSIEDALHERVDSQLDRADDLGTLAEFGPEDRRPANHLATIAIDGNAMGDLFARLVASGSTSKDWLSLSIKAATIAALDEATRACIRGGARGFPVVPHVLGGDDVLVSVPALLGVTFARSFLERFAKAVFDEISANDSSLLGALSPSPSPSASAGIVFAHAGTPFDQVTELAEGRLRSAKRAVEGREAALSWLDVTRDGMAVPGFHRPLTLPELSHAAPILTEIGAMPRHRIGELDRALAHDDPDTGRALALRLLRRHGYLAGSTQGSGATLVALIATGDIDSARDLIGLARWWR